MSRLRTDSVLAGAHYVIAAGCSCGWLRIVATPAEAEAAARVHRLLHKVTARRGDPRPTTTINEEVVSAPTPFVGRP
jgi:hypothetical protein